jgi:hypothetical protein
VLLEPAIEVLPKRAAQLLKVHEERGVLYPHELAARSQTDPRHQAVEVRMKPQLLVPRMQHRREAVNGGPQALGGRELLTQGAGPGGKEQIVSFLGVGAKEAVAQFRGQREGDQEVRGLDEFTLFALHPLGIGGAAAERAGLVIAGMKREVLAPALVAVKAGAAQRRSAAMSDRPEGAVLRGREQRFGFKKRRQKPAQHRDDGVAGRHALISAAAGGRVRP